MSMNNVDQAYAICIQAGVPVIIIGGPGTGKTSLTNAVARSMGSPVVELVCSSCDPTDIALPVVVDGRYIRIAPKWAHDCTDNTILFLDEFSCTPPAVPVSYTQLTLPTNSSV